MRIVFLGDNLHEILKPNFLKKKEEKKISINLLSVETVQGVLMVNVFSVRDCVFVYTPTFRLNLPPFFLEASNRLKHLLWGVNTSLAG